MLEAAARYVARELGLDAEQEEVVLFGLRIVTNLLAGAAVVAALAFALGVLWTTLLAFLVAGSMRTFAGGAHSRSSRNCVLLGAAYLVPAGWAAGRFGPGLGWAPAAALGSALFLLTLAALWAYAPDEPPEKPLASVEHRRLMRRAAFLSLAVWLAVLGVFAYLGWGPAAAGPGPWRALFLGGLAGWAWLALNLTPAGHRLAARVDGILGVPGKEVCARC